MAKVAWTTTSTGRLARHLKDVERAAERPDVQVVIGWRDFARFSVGLRRGLYPGGLVAILEHGTRPRAGRGQVEPMQFVAAGVKAVEHLIARVLPDVLDPLTMRPRTDVLHYIGRTVQGSILKKMKESGAAETGELEGLLSYEVLPHFLGA